VREREREREYQRTLIRGSLTFASRNQIRFDKLI